MSLSKPTGGAFVYMRVRRDRGLAAVLGVPPRAVRAESGTENRNYKGNGEYKLFRETEKRPRTLATTHAKRHNGRPSTVG